MVPKVASRLVPFLPLSSVKTSKPAPAPRVPASQAAASAADARARSEKAAAGPSFRDALRRCETLTAETLAPDLYRALLRALPASMRAWFQDIRDKKLAAAVEVQSRVIAK